MTESNKFSNAGTHSPHEADTVMRLGTLRILDGPEGFVSGRPAGRIVPILHAEMRIGRNPDWVELQLYNMTDRCSVSRLHCTVIYQPDMRVFFLRDEGSTSGTIILEGGGQKPENERFIRPHQGVELRHGDRIRLGNLTNRGALLEFVTTVIPAKQRPQRLIWEAADFSGTEPSARRVNGLFPLFRRQHGLDLIAGEADAEAEDTENAHQYDIFLSYSRQDSDIMRRLSHNLRAGGFRVWTDETLKPGEESWKRAIESAIEASQCVVVLLSPGAKQSEWVERELDYARAQKRLIFPILAKGTEQDAIPFSLIRSQRADIRNNYDAGVKTLIEAIRSYLQN